MFMSIMYLKRDLSQEDESKSTLQIIFGCLFIIALASEFATPVVILAP